MSAETYEETRTSPIRDPCVIGVIERMNAHHRRPPREVPAGKDPEAFADCGFPIRAGQNALIYLLAVAWVRARSRPSTSVGMPAMYFAAAIRDNGGGLVIGSEFVPAKVDVARRNLVDTGLAELLISVGDARQMLRDVGGPVGFALIDGWPLAESPSVNLIRFGLQPLSQNQSDDLRPNFLRFSGGCLFL